MGSLARLVEALYASGVMVDLTRYTVNRITVIISDQSHQVLLLLSVSHMRHLRRTQTDVCMLMWDKITSLQ
jgi:hypothetical protein